MRHMSLRNYRRSEKEGENIKTYIGLKCGHSYHEKCIREWLEIKGDCPICKKHIIDAENIV